MSLYVPNPTANVSQPPASVVEQDSRRDQMLRDLEQFLSMQLTNAKAVARKSWYGGKLIAGSSIASE
jgi:hypothetical protein